MLVKTFGSAVYGVEAITITVEVNWMETGTGYLIVGLPDNAVKESLQRIGPRQWTGPNLFLLGAGKYII